MMRMLRGLVLGLPLGACAAATAPDFMPDGAVATPPAAAIYWAVGLRYPDHPWPDCNDLAQAAAGWLRAQGLVPRLAVAVTETGEGHMVATVDTAEGTVVYDNRWPGARPWRNLPYRWVEREAGSPGEWVTVPEAPGQ